MVEIALPYTPPYKIRVDRAFVGDEFTYTVTGAICQNNLYNGATYDTINPNPIYLLM